MDNNLPLEAIEFPTEASTSNEEDLWKLYDPKKEEKSQASQSSTASEKAMEKAGKALPKHSGGKNLKRRATEEDQPDSGLKKPKRALKVRSGSKRVKT